MVKYPRLVKLLQSQTSFKKQDVEALVAVDPAILVANEISNKIVKRPTSKSMSKAKKTDLFESDLDNVQYLQGKKSLLGRNHRSLGGNSQSISKQPYSDNPYQTLQSFTNKATLNAQTSVKTDLTDKSEMVNNSQYGEFYTKLKHKVFVAKKSIRNRSAG